MNRCEIAFKCMNGLSDCTFAKYKPNSRTCVHMGQYEHLCGNADAREALLRAKTCPKCSGTGAHCVDFGVMETCDMCNGKGKLIEKELA